MLITNINIYTFIYTNLNIQTLFYILLSLKKPLDRASDRHRTTNAVLLGCLYGGFAYYFRTVELINISQGVEWVFSFIM